MVHELKRVQFSSLLDNMFQLLVDSTKITINPAQSKDSNIINHSNVPEIPCHFFLQILNDIFFPKNREGLIL